MTNKEIDQDIYQQCAESIQGGNVALFETWLWYIKEGEQPVPQEKIYGQVITKERFIPIAVHAIEDYLREVFKEDLEKEQGQQVMVE